MGTLKSNLTSAHSSHLFHKSKLSAAGQKVVVTILVHGGRVRNADGPPKYTVCKDNMCAGCHSWKYWSFAVKGILVATSNSFLILPTAHILRYLWAFQIYTRANTKIFPWNMATPFPLFHFRPISKCITFGVLRVPKNRANSNIEKIELR